MRDLQPPDSHYLNAASGWLELGNPVEAKRELAQVSSPGQAHPVALELHWQISAHEKNWAEALEAAQLLIAVDSENPSGWIHKAYSLHELRRTVEARDCLLPLVERFPDFSTIPYNLACYTCQLGELDQARLWLARAIRVRNKEEIQRAALTDLDLKPMWEEIQKLLFQTRGSGFHCSAKLQVARSLRLSWLRQGCSDSCPAGRTAAPGLGGTPRTTCFMSILIEGSPKPPAELVASGCCDTRPAGRTAAPGLGGTPRTTEAGETSPWPRADRTLAFWQCIGA